MAKKPAAAAPKNKWDDELEAIFAAHERIMAKSGQRMYQSSSRSKPSGTTSSML